MKPKITISLNPSYFCNSRCDFCYLTPEQLGDRKVLSIETLTERLRGVAEHYVITHLDLYGGEPTLLPKAYLQRLNALARWLGIEGINIITNLIKYPEFLNDPFYSVSVSYDMDVRPNHVRSFSNMQAMQRPFTVLMCATPELLKHAPVDVLAKLSYLKQMTSLEVKPYSKNQANDLGEDYQAYEAFVIGLIENAGEYGITIANGERIADAVLSNAGHAFSDDHLYLTPTGSFAVLDFDLNGKEYFRSIADMAAYRAWTLGEKRKVAANPVCNQCKYFGTCLSEHLKPVTNIDHSCNGFIKLLEWGEEYYS